MRLTINPSIDPIIRSYPARSTNGCCPTGLVSRSFHGCTVKPTIHYLGSLFSPFDLGKSNIAYTLPVGMNAASASESCRGIEYVGKRATYRKLFVDATTGGVAFRESGD